MRCLPFSSILLSFLFFGLTQCQTSPLKESPNPTQTLENKEPKKRKIGAITAVYLSQQLALVKQIPHSGELEDHFLSAQGASGSAALSWKGEKKGRYLAVDILSGNPTVGDIVLARPMNKTESDPMPLFKKEEAPQEPLSPSSPSFL